MNSCSTCVCWRNIRTLTENIPAVHDEPNKPTLSISQVPTMVKQELGTTSMAQTFWPRAALHLNGVMRLKTGLRTNEKRGGEAVKWQFVCCSLREFGEGRMRGPTCSFVCEINCLFSLVPTGHLLCCGWVLSLDNSCVEVLTPKDLRMQLYLEIGSLRGNKVIMRSVW